MKICKISISKYSKIFEWELSRYSSQKDSSKYQLLTLLVTRELTGLLFAGTVFNIM